MNPPELTGEALSAVRHRGSHLQIIACAGSGKTELVAQRVVDIFAEDIDPSAVVAFTFTKRAAEELKHRIEQRTSWRLGEDFLGRLNGCFIGTIHAYCFRLLQEHVPEYETYDVLDEHRLAAFITRVHKNIKLKELDPKLFRAINVFTRNLDVVDNERIPVSNLDEPLRSIIERFYGELEQYRFLTYGQVIARAVEELQNPDIYEAVHGKLAHLIVDEYQDVNLAQELLIKRLARSPVELCVVGDDDQSIYQWRGSDVGNIVTFQQRYPDVKTFQIVTNRRSRPSIIHVANDFAKTIAGRLEKEMRPHRESVVPEIVCWRVGTEADEAKHIAEAIKRLVASGFRYRDIAILVRASTSYPRLLEALTDHNIPVQPAGRTGLFREGDAQLFGKTFAYLADFEWRDDAYGKGSRVVLDDLVAEYSQLFKLGKPPQQRVRERLEKWRAEVENPIGRADLVGDYYDLIGECGVAEWDFNDPNYTTRLGSIARCSAILADYESIRRRTRPDPESKGEIKGGQDRGKYYFQWLAIHIQNWAMGAYEGFQGEDSFTLDAVDLTTIHQSKGLEWPVVFVPCVSKNRFPSSKTGQKQTWHIPDSYFSRIRYEGTENDERRLFYVALTRARDWLSVSTHDSPKVKKVAPSPFIRHLAGGDPDYIVELQHPPAPKNKAEEDDILSITFSELAEFQSCGLAYRLRSLIGFQPPLAPELGYGKAVHHVLRTVAEYTRRHNKVPSPDQIQFIFDDQFYLPAANPTAYKEMKTSARQLVDRYVASYADDLERVWAIERSFELHLQDIVITGRADVILEEDNENSSSLTIVDYKTATDDSKLFQQQLQIYTDAGRREGLDVRAAYIHDLKVGDRVAVDISEANIVEAENEVNSLVGRLRKKEYTPRPGSSCKRCDVRAMCRHAI